MNSEINIDSNKWHRQTGLIDQILVESLIINIDGNDESILGLLLQIDLLGACRGKVGSFNISRNSDDLIDCNLLNGLIDYDEITWGELQQHFTTRGMNFSLEMEGENNVWIGTILCPRPSNNRGLWLIHGNGSALLGDGEIIEPQVNQPKETMIDSATLICGISALLHRLIGEMDAFWKNEIVDRWLTLTLRVDETNPELALRSLESEFGPGTSSLSSDGQGSLIRYRIPIDHTPTKLLSSAHQLERLFWTKETEPVDVGPFPSKVSKGIYCFDSRGLPDKLSEVNSLILGVGGLGSWAAPLLLSGCVVQNSEMTIIDGDLEVEIHNLNRQILYDSKDLGVPKASAAEKKLINRFGMNIDSILGIIAPLGAQHIVADQPDFDDESISLREIIGEGEFDQSIINSLDSMDIALACLDNQNARTLLNRACYDRNIPMINGGGEGVNGIVEKFDGNICMVCEYGFEEAHATEWISCQEEGTRPVNSIVTTTAFIGAMQAAISLCILAAKRGLITTVPEGKVWNNGKISERDSKKLPWLDGDCNSHL